MGGPENSSSVILSKALSEIEQKKRIFKLMPQKKKGKKGNKNLSGLHWIVE